jgi:hypothetical protein
MYWILNLKVRCTQNGFSGQGNLQEYKGNIFEDSGKAYIVIWLNLEKNWTPPSHQKLAGEGLMPIDTNGMSCKLFKFVGREKANAKPSYDIICGRSF